MHTGFNDKFNQILKLELSQEKFEDENQVIPYLRLLTDYRYNINMSLHRKWGIEDSPMEEGKFYQIVPDNVDNGFFDWYYENRRCYQFFKTIEMALLHFVFYFHVWKKDREALKED
jgi:hypothetical protein